MAGSAHLELSPRPWLLGIRKGGHSIFSRKRRLLPTALASPTPSASLPSKDGLNGLSMDFWYY